jgi:20S proteasome subunit alpha 7
LEGDKEFSLHQLDPSGNFYKYFACCNGKGKQSGKTEVEKMDLQSLTVDQGLKEGCRILYTLFEEGKDKEFDIELSYITAKSGYKLKFMDGAEKAECVKWGKEKAEDEDDEEEEMQE